MGRLLAIWGALVCLGCTFGGGSEASSSTIPGEPAVIEVDLSDDWTPYLFAPGRRGGGFGDTYVALANGGSVDSPIEAAAKRAYLSGLRPASRKTVAWRPDESRPHPYLDVYGIPPTLSVLRRRARDEVMRPCFRDIDVEAIAALRGVVAYTNNGDARREAIAAEGALPGLRQEIANRGIATLSALRAAVRDEGRRAVIDQAVAYLALVAVQEQLVCEGLLDPETPLVRGGLDYPTHLALRRFEQKNRIFGWGELGPDTVAALVRSPSARLFDALRRAVAARVADAAGIVEDGTALHRGRPATYLDGEGRRRSVPNLIDLYTRAVLRHLGVASAETARRYLAALDGRRLSEGYKVTVRLPPLPPYYRPAMPLAIAIDRGDVYYDFPYDGRERRFQKRERRPSLTLSTTWRGQTIPLAVYSTTIGGWQNETAPDGYTYLKYKPSPPGEGRIETLIAGPTWMPPEGTPVDEILKTVNIRGRGVTVPDLNAVGPWFASAYGLVAAIHLGRDPDGGWRDGGIRSHGSHDYTSILKRYSHGCHRLHNHLAVRLYNFVLRRTPHRFEGAPPDRRTRRFTHEGRPFRIDVETDGDRFRLLAPISVKTLPGRVLGAAKAPLEGYRPRPDLTYGPDATFLRPMPGP